MEWRGKLPPGAQEQLDEAIAGWIESGVVCGIEVSTPGDCHAAARFAGMIFPLEKPPTLPAAGCERRPCCACFFLAVLKGEDGAVAKEAVPAGRQPGKLLRWLFGRSRS